MIKRVLVIALLILFIILFVNFINADSSKIPCKSNADCEKYPATLYCNPDTNLCEPDLIPIVFPPRPHIPVTNPTPGSNDPKNCQDMKNKFFSNNAKSIYGNDNVGQWILNNIKNKKQFCGNWGSNSYNVDCGKCSVGAICKDENGLSNSGKGGFCETNNPIIQSCSDKEKNNILTYLERKNINKNPCGNWINAKTQVKCFYGNCNSDEECSKNFCVKKTLIKETPCITKSPKTPISTDEKTLISASVRLKANIKGKTSGNHYASGTFIEYKNGKALILTCGHTFEDFNINNIDIFVDTFIPKKSGISGKLISYNFKDDYAYISIPLDYNPTIAPISSTGFKAGDRIITTGCSNGDDCTIEYGKINFVNKYHGMPNIEISCMPEHGRSGGGLFDNGYIIGVCTGQLPSDQCGLYANSESFEKAYDKIKDTWWMNLILSLIK